MMEETSHSMWVNSEAYRRAGIPENVQNDPQRGMIYMRDGSGRLNGIVLENAGIAMMEKAMDPKVNHFLNLSLRPSLRLLLSVGVSEPSTLRSRGPRVGSEAAR